MKQFAEQSKKWMSIGGMGTLFAATVTGQAAPDRPKSGIPLQVRRTAV